MNLTEELKRIKEIMQVKESNEEDIQLYIDLLSDMSPASDNYKKYYNKLKTDYGVDFNKINNDDEYIRSATLSNIKSKSDFLSWAKYIKYAKQIFHLRHIDISLKRNKSVPYETAKTYLNNMGITVEYKKYDGSGNYAWAGGSTVTLPDNVNLGTLIHEIGHVFDDTIYRDGVSKKQTNASSSYGIGDAGEVFAENVMHFFMNPDELKKHLPEVYSDLNERIPNELKSNIEKMFR